MAVTAVDKPAVQRAVLADAQRIGKSYYPDLKIRSIQYHTALGLTPDQMSASLAALGFTVDEAAQLVQFVNNLDALVATFEGTNGTTYTARNMVPDFAAVQGLD